MRLHRKLSPEQVSEIFRCDTEHAHQILRAAEGAAAGLGFRMSQPEVAQLCVLRASVASNAVDFRKRGRTCCAVEAEQTLARLTEIMEGITSA